MNAVEKRAIKRLHALELIWPKTLWLFSANGNLHIMGKNADGSRMMDSNGGVAQDGIIDTIDIENDGGDW